MVVPITHVWSLRIAFKTGDSDQEKKKGFWIDNLMNNVLYLVPDIDYGGSTKSITDIINGLDRNNWNPIIALQRGNLLQAHFQRSDISTTFLPYVGFSKNDLPKFLYCIFLTYYKIRKMNISLVHSNDMNSHNYGIIAAKLANVPIVAHVRIALTNMRPKNRAILNKADVVIAVSSTLKNNLVELGIKKQRIRVIGNFIEPSNFQNVQGIRIRNEFSLDDSYIIGNVGRLFFGWKRYDLFFEVCKKVLETFPKTKIMLVGAPLNNDSSIVDKMKKMAQDIGVFDNLIITGFREDIPDIMNCMDVFVLSSIGEGFGRVIVESLSVGTPVVAFDDCGQRDIIIDGINGFLVPIGDTNTMAERVCQILKDPKLKKKLGEEGKRIAKEKFSKKVLLKKLMNIYEELIG
jgi:glycosyltransferase involved in cell wall biosynthesis